MTPKEFKAWFDGFTEAMGGIPNKDQWKRIKERVAEIDGRTVTEYQYINHYWPRYWGQYAGAVNPVWLSAGQNTVTAGNTIFSALASEQRSAFNGTTAMYALGKADAASFGAT